MTDNYRPTSPDSASGFVRRHLRDHHGIVAAQHLGITTSPGDGPAGTWVTVVSRPLMRAEWSDQLANNLADVLAGLPDATVTLQPVRDRVTVVWGGRE